MNEYMHIYIYEPFSKRSACECIKLYTYLYTCALYQAS